MLNVVEFLKNNSLADLESKFSIKVKRHQKYNNLVLLKYDQLNTVMNDMTRECRGIILNENENWNVVCYTYRRFANYGEGWGDNIDFSTAHIFEKVDGSLCQLYYYNGEWQVATSGTPDGSGEVMGTNITFNDLFFKVWKELGYNFPSDTNIVYAFELCTPYNRVVVRHQKSRLVLHGARRLSDLRELNPVVEAHLNGWECVKIFSFQTLDDIIAATKDMDPMETEGFVLRDNNYNRVKIKSPAYVAVAHLRDGFSTRRLLEIIRTGEGSEFLTYYNEYEKMYWEIKAKYEHFVGRIEGFYDAIKDIEERKQFALLAAPQKFSGILFGIKYGKLDTIKAGLATMNIKHLEDWLDIKSVEL